MIDEIPLPQRMFQMITGFWVTQAVGTFAELGFAEQLANGAQSARALATKAGTDPDATYRLLRGLASVGVLVQDSGRFQLTPLGATLRADAPGSMRDMARTMMAEPHWLPWTTCGRSSSTPFVLGNARSTALTSVPLARAGEENHRGARARRALRSRRG